MYTTIDKWGWSNHFEMLFQPFLAQSCIPGRIISASRELYQVMTEDGVKDARLTGKFRYQTGERSGLPAVGDWAVLQSLQDSVLINCLLPRRSKFSRKIAGDVVEEQVIAANIDTVFLLTALNNDFNLRRIERYLTLTYESGARPVVVLSKKDLCPRAEHFYAETTAVAAGAPVHMISSVTGEGLEQLALYAAPGETVALLGSSGAGKSTLLNCLAGSELQMVNEVRFGDDRGRHTTTRADLFSLPGGALIIDTPGLRELQLWGSGEGLQEAFDDIAELTGKCRFNDCQHRNEPGCAVQEALQNGQLSLERFNSYLKLLREMAYLERSQNYRARVIEQEKWKAITKAQRKKRK